MRRLLIVGGAGQLGIELARIDWGANVELYRPDRSRVNLLSPESIHQAFMRDRFDAVINAAAFTSVDGAETESETAFAVNATAPALLADASRRAGIPLIHISTDYVFAGNKAAPHHEDDEVGPLGVYGCSKLAGEIAVRQGNPRSTIVRTAWLLSPHRTNFLKTIRKLSIDRPELRVVDDQVGCPTSAADLASAIRAITLAHLDATPPPAPIYHVVNGGHASWWELAEAVLAHMGGTCVLHPISTAEYPTPARRPADSRLATLRFARDFGLSMRPWREAVADILNELDGSAA